jgi:putative peptidoglycan lipid II flippase
VTAPPPRAAPRAPAVLVAAGILLSRLAGLVRQRVFAHYFSTSAAADAFTAAFRIPNYLQNLFGEGVLSASFIPVYAGLLARGEEEEAGRLAGAIGALLGLVTAGLVLLGVALAPALVTVIAGGFDGETRLLAIRLTRILFPGAGLLVWSAWCLGILNSHRRFFLSYAAPVVWNAAMIATMLGFGPGRDQFPLAAVVAWGSVVGSALQFLVQLPAVLRLVPRLRLAPRLADARVRTVLRNFVPVFVGRGVVQISAYVDSLLATLLTTGAVATLNYAQLLYTLPVSLFGMSISAAELPELAAVAGGGPGDTGPAAVVPDETAAVLRQRLERGLRQIAFFIVPSSVAFLALGDVIAAALYQSGRFTHADAVWVWAVLAGATVGLLASTLGRLYASTYYALHDTRTPLRFAVVRVILTTGLGYLFAIPLPPAIGLDAKWGVAGLTVSAGIAGWVEFILLRRALNVKIGRTVLAPSYTARLYLTAAVAAAAAWGMRLSVGAARPVVDAILILGAYSLVYVGGTWWMGLPEARALMSRVLAGGRRRS